METSFKLVVVKQVTNWSKKHNVLVQLHFKSRIFLTCTRHKGEMEIHFTEVNQRIFLYIVYIYIYIFFPLNFFRMLIKFYFNLRMNSTQKYGKMSLYWLKKENNIFSQATLFSSCILFSV